MRLSIVLLLITSILNILLGEYGVDAAGSSSLLPVVERVFIRRRRALLAPKGTHLKFTVNLSKRMIAQYPRGLNFVLEAAAYYPMPATREELLPKRLRKPTTAKPVAPNHPTEPTYVYIPGSLVRYKAKPAAKPAKVNRIDATPVRYYGEPQKYAHYADNWKWQQWANKYTGKNYTDKYAAYQAAWQPKNPHAKWTQYTTTAPAYKWSAHGNRGNWPNADWSKRHHHWKRHSPEMAINHDDYYEHVPMFFEDMEPFEESPHYHRIRQRRQLFHHLAGIGDALGFDMKSCLLRAMCEAKQFLLPPGYSMIQDILRVVFTFPTINGLDDEYSQIMRANFETCDKSLRSNCPFSLLHWLLNMK